MNKLTTKLKSFDEAFVAFFQPKIFGMLRISIGFIYVLFGALKFFPNYSPAEELAATTIDMITLGVFMGDTALMLLAIIEVGIGIGLMVNFKTKGMVMIALWHMVCTFMPMIVLPQYAYSNSPYSLSLVGQYILKNMIIISALIGIYTNHKKG